MKAKIKIGASISQDFGYGKWPQCKPVKGQTVDPDTVFDAKWNASGKYWDCRADGFGAMESNGIKGTYGNGSIFVFEKNGVEEVLSNGKTLSEIVEAATMPPLSARRGEDGNKRVACQ